MGCFFVVWEPVEIADSENDHGMVALDLHRYQKNQTDYLMEIGPVNE